MKVLEKWYVLKYWVGKRFFPVNSVTVRSASHFSKWPCNFQSQLKWPISKMKYQIKIARVLWKKWKFHWRKESFRTIIYFAIVKKSLKNRALRKPTIILLLTCFAAYRHPTFIKEYSYFLQVILFCGVFLPMNKSTIQFFKSKSRYWR